MSDLILLAQPQAAGLMSLCVESDSTGQAMKRES